MGLTTVQRDCAACDCTLTMVKYVDCSLYQIRTQGQYWAGRALPPYNGNYQYGRR